MKRLLRDIADIGAGQGAPQGDSNYCDDGTPFVKAGNLEALTSGGRLSDIQKVTDAVAKAYKLKLYPKGTVLFAKSGMSCLKGYVYVLPQEAYVVSHLACIIPKEEISEFLRFFFSYHKPNQLVKDASYPSISLADIGALEIDTKDRPTRASIISTLRSVERIIGLRKQQLQNFNDLIKARFVEMFRKYEPSVVLEEIAEIVSGITKGRRTTETKLKEVPYMAVSNVKDGYIDWTTVKTILATDKEIEQYRLLPKDILMTEGGDPDKLGRGAMIYAPPPNCIHQNHIFRVRLNQTIILPEYFAEYLQSMIVKTYFLKCAKQTTGIASINMRQLRALPVVVPSVEFQKTFVSFLEHTNKSKSVIKKALDEAQLLFDSLMQQYFGNKQ